MRTNDLGNPTVPVASAEPDSTDTDSNKSEEIVVEGEERGRTGRTGEAPLRILGLSRWETSAGATALSMRGDFASAGTIALSIEVPFVFDRQDPHPLCVRKVFFKAQSYISSDHIRAISMSALPPKADMCSAQADVR